MTKNTKIVIVLLILAIVIAVVPLAMIKDSEFEGSDGQAEEVIEELSPDYEPWAENIMEPPGGETESLLFSLQAALGSGVLFFGFGYLVGRSRRGADKDGDETADHDGPTNLGKKKMTATLK
ncbi:MAG: energy-coupling factor ABC transporter substrate-binding protein [Fastidiosipilaceae bacterium]|jgi:cobalt/nickel transport protein